MFVSAGVLLVATSLSVNWLLLIALVIVGMLTIAFTPYRYVLGYFVLGMMYWIVVEGLHWLVSHLSALTSTDAYVVAIGLSMLPMMIMLNWQPNNNKALKKSKKHTMSHHPQQINAGHRPVILEKDTDFHQNFVRHSSVFDSKN